MAEFKTPAIGDIVDYFEPAPRVGRVTNVHSDTTIDVVDSDGGQHLSVTRGRKKNGWGWPDDHEPSLLGSAPIEGGTIEVSGEAS